MGQKGQECLALRPDEPLLGLEDDLGEEHLPPLPQLSFGAFCLDVRTLTFCQLMGFPLNH